MSIQDENSGSGGRGMRMQLALLTAAFFLLVAFQTYELLRARTNLVNAHTQQDQGLQQSQNIRNQLQALAQGTLQLANEGDESARVIVDGLRQQGVTINPPAPTPAAPR